MKQYAGRRQGFAVIVTVDGRRLNPRLDLWNHSPTGFEWGYCGSGPAQLALAILADHCANDEQALNFRQRFPLLTQIRNNFLNIPKYICCITKRNIYFSQ